jgi:N-acetylglutamate synthase-like GNAT family acetyltransferase
MGDVGFFLAEQDGKLIGLIGWHVEDLVVRVTDLLVSSSRGRRQIARLLFEAMESAAMELNAEAALLLLPRPSGSELIEFCRALGYEHRVVADLPRSWGKTAREAGRAHDEKMLVKQLRSEHVIRPL